MSQIARVLDIGKPGITALDVGDADDQRPHAAIGSVEVDARRGHGDPQRWMGLLRRLRSS